MKTGIPDGGRVGLNASDLERCRQLLAEQTQSLDGATQSRLNRARQAALDTALRPRTRHWSAWSIALPAAALALLVVLMLPRMQVSAPADPGLAEVEALLAEPVVAVDAEWLASDAPSELIEDWEFFAWLDQQQPVARG